ncbi:hypothetical protein QQF64_009261 [Cirrhinus molitorella]|uniref:Uncharacterized protein n=1 Tax=Cirrhinus molitorella TaxID=172907 RepID=A0ABR3M3R4_9TELE
MGLLAMLTQDCNIIRLYDMQHTPMPFSDEVEPTTNERSVQLCSKSISSSFAWHLSAQNCMMVVSPNWVMNNFTVFEHCFRAHTVLIQLFPDQ